MSEGKSIIEQLKQHVVLRMKSEAACAPDARGLGNNEIESLCDLALNLDSQDHYLTYSILHALIKDDVVERVTWPTALNRPKYRLRA